MIWLSLDNKDNERFQGEWVFLDYLGSYSLIDCMYYIYLDISF